MSTRMSLYYSDSMHLYYECMDEDSVYIEVRKDRLDLTMELSIQDFARFACSFDLLSLERQCELSDDQINDYCKRQVGDRINSQGIAALCGIGVYGSVSLPREQQELNGFNFFVSRKNKLKKILLDIKTKRSFPFMLGLEDIVSANYDD